MRSGAIAILALLALPVFGIKFGSVDGHDRPRKGHERRPRRERRQRPERRQRRHRRNRRHEEEPPAETSFAVTSVNATAGEAHVNATTGEAVHNSSLIHSGGNTSSRSNASGVSEAPAQVGAIPKLIHRTFARDIVGGKFPNPVWAASDASWKRLFPEGEYNYTLWTDDMLRKFHTENCENETGPIENYPNSISLSDLGRYCILWKLGGIYTDFDYEPRANFYGHLVPDRVNLVGSPYKRELVQNALMASPPGRPYWLAALRKSHVEDRLGKSEDPPQATGPGLLNSLDETHNESVVHVLPCREFQRATHVGDADEAKGCDTFDGEIALGLLGIHWGTWSWMRKTGEGRDGNTETDSLFHTLFKKLHPDQKIVEFAQNGERSYIVN